MTSVLLVDDDKDALAAWRASCAADGFEVRSARDGQSVKPAEKRYMPVQEKGEGTSW
jgi:DNA-binding response OmpR family regulator